jgi:hypothetical protein
MYSLRWTFVSMARASGEAAFNVSRLIGHARSTIVDTIYAHTVDSGLAGVSQSVEQRVGLKQAEPAAPTDPPVGPRQPPRLRVIDGGRHADRDDQRDIRRTIDDPVPTGLEAAQVIDSNGGADGTRTRETTNAINNLLYPKEGDPPVDPYDPRVSHQISHYLPTFACRSSSRQGRTARGQELPLSEAPLIRPKSAPD